MNWLKWILPVLVFSYSANASVTYRDKAELGVQFNNIINGGCEASTSGWVGYSNTQTVTITNASPAVFTVGSTTGFFVGMPVSFTTGGSLPTGLTSGTTYWISSVDSSTTFKVSASLGGSNVNTSSAGSGTHTFRPLVPVNATGGSLSGLTFSRSTSSPLVGNASCLLTQSNSTVVAGQGVSYAFTIPTAYEGQVHSIRFDFNADSNFSAANGTTAPNSGGVGDSDLEIFIYDVTNSVLIPVSPQVITSNGSNNYTFKGTFQAASNSTSYRLAVHSSKTSSAGTGYNFKWDSVYVGPQTLLQGVPVTDWVQYTPTISAWSTNTSATGQWRRVGDTMEIQVSIALTGAPTGTLSSISLPLSYSIDTNKIANYAAGTGIFGVCNIQAAGTGQFLADVLIGSTTTIKPAVYSASGSFVGGDNSITATVPATFANGDFVKLTARIPITSWSSGTLMSNDTDTRVVAAKYNVSGSFTTSSTTPVNYDTQIFDTHGAVTTSASAWKFTAPIAGYYRVCITDVASVASANNLKLYKNGVSQYALVTFNTTNTTGGCQSIQLVAGDFIDVRGDGSITLQNAATFNIINIERISGPSTIAASDSVNLKYFNTAGTSFTTLAALPYAVKVFDNTNSYNTSTGVFTAPISGKYAYSASVISLTNLGSSNDWDLQMIKNNSTLVDIDRRPGAGGADTYQSLKFSGIIDLLAGDTLTVKIENSSGTMTLNTTSGYNQLSIWRTGN